jgi:hypothetical protein
MQTDEQERRESPVQSPKMFASMFTMSVFLTFGYCLTTLIYLAWDPDSRFFIGRWPLWGLLWVPVWAGAHYYHVTKKKPLRSVMMLCVFGPAATYFIIGWIVLHEATHIHTVLRSSDCSRSEEFKEFNDGALAARAFHNKCLANSKEALLIHYCPGYEDERDVDNRAQTWEYLKYAEHNYGCAGFCNVAGDPSMWTYQGFQDSCASATANVMKAKVAALAFQMMVYNIIIVVMFLGWIEVMSPTLKAVERGESLPERSKYNWPKWSMKAPSMPGFRGGQEEPRVLPPPQYPSQPVGLTTTLPPQPAWGQVPPTTSLPPAPMPPPMPGPPPGSLPPMGPQTIIEPGFTVVETGSPTSMSIPPSMPPPMTTSLPPATMTSMGPPMVSMGPPTTSMGPPMTSMGPPMTSMGPREEIDIVGPRGQVREREFIY